MKRAFMKYSKYVSERAFSEQFFFSFFLCSDGNDRSSNNDVVEDV